MDLSPARVQEIVDIEVSRIADEAARLRISELRVRPYPVEREWYYGTAGQRYTCWTVLEHPELNFGIAYCEEGFGPRRPWGFVALSGPQMGIGPDFEWYSSLEDALKDSPLWEDSGLAK
jgi:hypothetical protein